MPVLDTELTELKQHISTALKQATSGQSQLDKAIQYSILNGGKRLRPLLTYATGLSFGASKEQLEHAATAVELIHCYSLIHDDLPAMDNDELRRGVPTSHIKFNEATAILAGDALQALAFEIICASTLNQQTALEIIQVLAQACGKNGMALGQMLDLEAENKTCSIHEIEHIHQHKTGKLISASLTIGCLAAACTDKQMQQISTIGDQLGLAFQIQDDLLELETDTQKLGKSNQSDINKNKSTYPRIIGVQATKDVLKQQHEKILHQLDEVFNNQHSLLHKLINHTFSRSF